MEGLLAWYDRHKRTLPWRVDTDPYRVWVSEVMLQQTRVDTVLGYYGRWLERFPDVTTLAAASEADVMAAWAGLGYYGRARRMHAAAKHIVGHGMPRDAATWKALPGIGAYTAGAIASIALGEAVPAIDGNAIRVLARWHGLHTSADDGPGSRAVRALAQRHLDPSRPGDWNQAIMDLGSQVCTPVAPRCEACPIAAGCVARATGAQEDIPVLRAKKRPVVQAMQFARIVQAGRVLVVPRPEHGLLAGTWMLPGGDDGEALEDQVMAQTGLQVRLGDARQVKHVFTHRIWHMDVHDAQVIEGVANGHWVDVDAPDVALSTAARKAALA